MLFFVMNVCVSGYVWSFFSAHSAVEVVAA